MLDTPPDAALTGTSAALHFPRLLTFLSSAVLNLCLYYIAEHAASTDVTVHREVTDVTIAAMLVNLSALLPRIAPRRLIV